MLFALAAGAHVGDVIDTLDVRVDRAGSGEVHIEGSFGLLTMDGDEAEWVCHEAVMAEGVQQAPHYVQSAAGRFASWTTNPAYGRDGQPVWTSADRCDWEPLPGLSGEVVAEVSFRGEQAWAATATGDGSDAVHRVVDGTFVPTSLVTEGLVLSVRADGPSVWALTTEGDELVLWHSADGEVFVAHPIVAPAEFARPLRGAIAEIDSNDGGRAWLIVDPIGADVLYEVTDAGATVVERWRPNDRLTDLSLGPDGALAAILNDRRPWRETADGWVEGVDLPDASGVDRSGGTAWFSNRAFVNDLLLTRSDDGVASDRTWVPADIVRSRSCPDGSTQQTVCDPLWSVLEPRLQPVVDTGEPSFPSTPEPGTCGCQGTSGGSFLLVAPFLLRRRTSRASGRTSPLAGLVRASQAQPAGSPGEAGGSEGSPPNPVTHG